MKSLKIIRRRIQSVKNTQKVTKAMKLVAAAKLRRAQYLAISARGYTEALRGIVIRVSSRAGLSAHPLMRRRTDIKSLDALVITSDRGLCGSFNENLLISLMDSVSKHKASGIKIKLFVYGKKGWQYLSKRHSSVERLTILNDEKTGVFSTRVSSMLAERFLSHKSDGANVAFMKFGSAARQDISFWDLLPLHSRGTSSDRLMDYIYEPSRDVIHDELAVSMISRTIEQSILESHAAELAARMMAMDNATKNADEMIGHLTLEYHKARQSSITSELLDIVGGAEALR